MRILGPRNSAVRALRGEEVSAMDMVTDRSPWGVWCDDGPLEERPPELWVDRIHDATGDWEL